MAVNIRGILETVRPMGPTERHLQEAVQGTLEAHDIPYIREFQLSAQSRPDFYLQDEGTVIEVKLSPRPRDLDQIQRYAGHPGVRAVILLSRLPLRTEAVPTHFTIAGVTKPVYVITVWKNWLL